MKQEKGSCHQGPGKITLLQQFISKLQCWEWKVCYRLGNGRVLSMAKGMISKAPCTKRLDREVEKSLDQIQALATLPESLFAQALNGTLETPVSLKTLRPKVYFSTNTFFVIRLHFSVRLSHSQPIKHCTMLLIHIQEMIFYTFICTKYDQGQDFSVSSGLYHP